MIRLYRDLESPDEKGNGWEEAYYNTEEEKKAKIKELHEKLKYGIWSLAYENNSEESYQETIGTLDELVKLIMK